MAQSPWYGGIEYNTYEVDEDDIDIDYKSIGVAVGYKYTQNISFEGSVFFGNGEESIDSLSISLTDGSSYNSETKIDKGFDLRVKGFYPIHQNVSLFGTAKYRYISGDFYGAWSDGANEKLVTDLSDGSITRYNAASISESSTKLRLGAGGRFSPNEAFNIDIGYYLDEGLSAGLFVNF